MGIARKLRKSIINDLSMRGGRYHFSRSPLGRGMGLQAKRIFAKLEANKKIPTMDTATRQRRRKLERMNDYTLDLMGDYV